MSGGTTRRTAVIIDDDPDIRSLVETVLISSGFETITASNGRDGVEMVRRHQPTVITLDVDMPGMDGFSTVRLIREISHSHVIMITGFTDEIDVVQGLSAGADDYITKPFRPRELRARVERVLARDQRGSGPVDAQHPDPVVTASTAPPATPPVARPAAEAEPVAEAVSTAAASGSEPQPPAAPVIPDSTLAEPPAEPAGRVGTEDASSEVLVHDELEVDPATRIVRVQGREVELTRSEFDLMVALLESGRRVRSKADLVLALRGESYVTDYYVTDADKRAIEVHMANLRRKIGDDANTPRWIETVRGVGYRLTAG